ncbi:hypothetical protein [Paenibacillus sp. H1-7]|uniref:hypothetical protein n=1 Tax=Paenibacillus sp. H1-7 TaxID=2282849 RepID=UPI001EF9A886|nr:hypothetical protein [Paenibacillus sp. H1-7]
MGKNKWLFAAACVIGLSVMAAPGQSSAAEQSVAVSLPKFEVKLNGNQVENDYRQYPLLVYKDITYVPMTWYDSRLLGLETGWSAQDGLSIAKGSVTSSYAAYAADHKNAGSARATISSFGITINGKTVDNAKEPYPLLTFRDVTYFPLTWKFAHEEFGWDYVWDPSAGLAITADNPKVEKVSLPAAAGGNNVALFKGYYYFTETEGTTVQVYRAPEQDTSSKQRVYSYNGESVYGFNNYLQFWTANDELWFSYHVGGATMGSDVYCKVGDDGKATLEHRGYLDFKPTTNGTLIIRQSVPPGGNNLSLAPAGQEDRNGGSVGKPDLIYGWHITDNGGGRGFAGDDRRRSSETKSM